MKTRTVLVTALAVVVLIAGGPLAAYADSPTDSVDPQQLPAVDLTGVDDPSGYQYSPAVDLNCSPA